jgi:hypothetical protein
MVLASLIMILVNSMAGGCIRICDAGSPIQGIVGRRGFDGK